MLFAARAGITGPDIFTLALRLFLGSDYFSVILVCFFFGVPWVANCFYNARSSQERGFPGRLGLKGEAVASFQELGAAIGKVSTGEPQGENPGPLENLPSPPQVLLPGQPSAPALESLFFCLSNGKEKEFPHGAAGLSDLAPLQSSHA